MTALAPLVTDAAPTRVFVAGHTGLLGRALLRALARRAPRYSVVEPAARLDLAQAEAVRAFFERMRPQFVLLAAGRVGGIGENQRHPADLARANLAIQISVLDAAHRADVQGLLLFGSSCMYPRECAQPMSEDAIGSGPLEPTSRAYATAKLAGVELCRAYRAQHGRRYFAMVPATLYGPWDHYGPHGHVIPQLIERFDGARQQRLERASVLGSGRPRREFLHVDDAAEAALFLMDQRGELDVVNAGWGEDLSIRELAECVREVVEYPGALEFDTAQPDGAPCKLLDVSQLRGLGFRPHVALRAGLQDSYRWYREERPSLACS